jgi:transcriptional/translational regulatory protein YebC/TACO1
MDMFATVRDSLANTLGDAQEAKIMWRPLNLIACDEATAVTLIKMMDALDSNDDVQHVYANFEVSDEVAEKLAQ